YHDLLVMGDDDTDGDGVIDFVDSSAATPPDVMVNRKGVPLDEDGDFIPDYRDKEPGTAQGGLVNEHGVLITDKMSEEAYAMYMDSTGKYQTLTKVKGKDLGTDAPGFRVQLGAFKTGVAAELINKYLSLRDIKSVPDDSV